MTEINPKLESAEAAQKRETKNNMEKDGGEGSRSRRENVRRGETIGLKQRPLAMFRLSPMIQRKEQKVISKAASCANSFISSLVTHSQIFFSTGLTHDEHHNDISCNVFRTSCVML